MYKFTLQYKPNTGYQQNTYIHVVEYCYDSRKESTELSELLTNEYVLFVEKLIERGCYIDNSEAPTIGRAWIRSSILGDLDKKSKDSFKEWVMGISDEMDYPEYLPQKPQIIFDHYLEMNGQINELELDLFRDKIKRFDLIEKNATHNPCIMNKNGGLVYSWYDPDKMDSDTICRFYAAEGYNDLYILNGNDFVEFKYMPLAKGIDLNSYQGNKYGFRI